MNDMDIEDIDGDLAEIEAIANAQEKARLNRAAKALIKEYRKIWPGRWPAMPEAIRLAQAVLTSAKP